MKTLKQFMTESVGDINNHIHDALKGRYETAKGKHVYGALLSDIHDHLKSKGVKMSARALEDHLDNNRRTFTHEQGHSLMGWTRKGLTKRSKARFYHAGKEFVVTDDLKKHIPGNPEYIEFHKK
jgi:hypothetical protein